jgi:hypothetical protein
MKFELLRLKDDGDTTIGVFLIDGIAFCGCVEDQDRESGQKVKSETRIPEGTYKVSLRKEGGFHNRYSQKYDFHKGMLCVWNKPNWVLENDGKKFQYILIHLGNTDDHTAGCLLPNYSIDFKSAKGGRSGDAYKDLYPILVDAIEKSSEGYIELEVKDINKG